MKTGRIRTGVLVMILMILVSGCGSDQGSSGMMSYKEMKSMVIDILKTEDGQKALEEVSKKQDEEKMKSKAMQMLSSGESEQIQLAVKNVLTDPEFPKTLEGMMTDPKFAGEFAKAVQKENKQLHKDLMKDPEYQGLLLQIMKDPEYEKMLMDLMKSKQYRQQAMTIMQDALKSPLFRTELMEMMKTVLEEESKPKDEKKKEGQESEGSEGGEKSE
ncbi:spore germination lipoprotein GerD [Marinicrinis sediminis]|uniref:Spore germination lipoprotein GerD n=1 Tax=Marinicrinis sediminis TaxID=1652465 RepID=A0ABW5RDE9_9BACL